MDSDMDYGNPKLPVNRNIDNVKTNARNAWYLVDNNQDDYVNKQPMLSDG